MDPWASEMMAGTLAGPLRPSLLLAPPSKLPALVAVPVWGLESCVRLVKLCVGL